MRPIGVPAAAIAVGLVAASCGTGRQRGATSSDIVVDASPTIVVAREMAAVDSDGDGTEVVVIDASASFDRGGDSLAFEWSRGFETIGEGPVLTESLDIGEHIFTLTATNQLGLTDVNSVVVRVLAPYVQDPGGPDIELWGGFVMHIDSGAAQRWFDVPGNVSDQDGIISISASVNGGRSRELSIGPDGRRLAGVGDFNVDILREQLQLGENVVRIQATDVKGARTVASMSLVNDSLPPPELPLTVDWRSQALDGLVEVVDGDWRIDGARVAIDPDAMGYDRLLAIGERSWADYGVSFDFVVDEISPEIGPFSNSPTIGMFLRWNGHNDSLTAGAQPRSGLRPETGLTPTPLGAVLGYVFLPDGSGVLQLLNHRSVVVSQDDSVQVVLGVPYRLRARVETTAAGSTYRARLWQIGETEPAGWPLIYNAGSADLQPQSGSVGLLAHELSANFGAVSIRPLN